MGNPVVHFEIVGKDPQALQRFYSDAFGWRMQGGLPTYAMAYTGGEGGIDGGVGAAPDGGGASRVTVYVQVEDLDAALRKIERLGGSQLVGPSDVPGGPVFALFADPAGNLVGLLKAGSGQGAR
jgi:predicted enzyme related to lactoylglutathione lyase